MDQTQATFKDPTFDPSTIEGMNSEPPPTWDQWYFPGESIFNNPFPVDGNHCHYGLDEIEGFIPEFIHEPLSSVRTSSFMTQESLEHQPSSDTTNPDGSSNIEVTAFFPSPPQFETDKQYKEGSASSSYRRSFTETNQVEQSAEKQAHASTQQSETNKNGAFSPSGSDEQMKKLREKNSRAANKVRVRKRQVERNLETTEQNMEQTNRELTSRAKELGQQVHHLKMQLLQHVGCGCFLIQEYIASEAHRYIQDMSSESSQTTK
ncbi:hypothetical protein FPOAC2_12002 [Fusarium poae]|uniref:BZIP domain-containing protein n=1 Tax=Fusarium poae TaxID=36050 RepID=A0A1B8AF92_FUSPO|nr:hypothetical protein FPOAC1_011689 [Fusarium poae]KAG8666867.1 hypothetical protein FPOAC1_011689 [Fusarium poae]OBS19113.1 hypothetical protein FPOA_10837 [Fusarium poae]